MERLRKMELVELINYCRQHFVEEDDAERLALIDKALGDRTWHLHIHDDETERGVFHAYLMSSAVSSFPIFLCVLVARAAVQRMLAASPFVVCESAALQVVTGTIDSAIRNWAARMFPEDPRRRSLELCVHHIEAPPPSAPAGEKFEVLCPDGVVRTENRYDNRRDAEIDAKFLDEPGGCPCPLPPWKGSHTVRPVAEETQ